MFAGALKGFSYHKQKSMDLYLLKQTGKTMKKNIKLNTTFKVLTEYNNKYNLLM